jgi:hypothetical protein
MDEERAMVAGLPCQMPLEVGRIDRVPPGQPVPRLLNRTPVWRDVLRADRAGPDETAR